MADLEKMGYITHPHTSAGRVPTDSGYRIYVNTLMRHRKLLNEEKDSIRKRLERAEGDVHQLLQEASRILGHVTRELGVVLTPWLSWGILDSIEFIALSENKVLAVVRVRSRLVKTVVLEVKSALRQKDLKKAAQILNERLSGLTLDEVRSTLSDRLPVEVKSMEPVSTMLERASDLFDFSEPLEVHTCGTQHILMQPEFADTDMLERILSLVDDRRKLIALFNKNIDKTDVSIGRENRDSHMRPFTVISTTYKRGKDVGTLGIIGPTRLQYGKILPLVEYISNVMSDNLS
jgi:heat-inducible transcriptional repressor